MSELDPTLLKAFSGDFIVKTPPQHDKKQTQIYLARVVQVRVIVVHLIFEI